MSHGLTGAVSPFGIERQRWEAQQEQWRREEEARRAAKAPKDSKEELLQIIDCAFR